MASEFFGKTNCKYSLFYSHLIPPLVVAVASYDVRILCFCHIHHNSNCKISTSFSAPTAKKALWTLATVPFKMLSLYCYFLRVFACAYASISISPRASFCSTHNCKVSTVMDIRSRSSWICMKSSTSSAVMIPSAVISIKRSCWFFTELRDASTSNTI